MKAVRWHACQDVRVEEIPEPPPPSQGQVQVEVTSCGLCGTDVREYAAGPLFIAAGKPHPLSGVRAPVVLGHEIAGRVIAIGSGVERVKVGDRVAISPTVGCLECEWCRSGLIGLCTNAATVGFSWHGGGYSRSLNIYESMCYLLPASVSDEMGALVGPVAEALHVLDRVNLQAGDRLAIVGGGTIGLFALQAAKAAGVREVTVIEPLEKRREIALRYGACATIDPFSEEPLQAVRQVTGGKGVDAVVECSGAKTAGMLAASIARPRGRIAILGIFEQPALLNYFDLVVGEKQIYGSVSGYGFFDPAIQLLADGKVEVDGLITGRIELDELPDMLKKLSQNPEEHIKVMVSPGDS